MKKIIPLKIGRAFPEDLTLQDWVEEGVAIYTSAEQLTWHLADWAAFGERTFGTLKEFCEKHGMNYGTLRNYAYVAANVEMSRRRDTLSFGHHTEVAPLPAREQARWLERALTHNWSVAELRRQLRAGKQTTDSDGPKFHFEDKAVLELRHALASRPREYWTPSNRELWRGKLKPLVDIYQQLCAGSFPGGPEDR